MVMALSLIPTPALANPFDPERYRQRLKPILDVLPTDLRRPACPTTVLQVIWNQDVAAKWDDSPVHEIADLADSLTAGKRTDREKMKAVFDWVSQNVTYDGNLPDDQRDAFDAYTLRRSTCGGYTRLCRLMGVIVGLQVAEIAGISNEENPFLHDWNAVLLDGEWLFFDATWAMWDIGQYYHVWTSAIIYDDIYQWDFHATEVGTPDMINFTPRRGFMDQCPANVVIPDTVTQVSSFYGCPNLETLTLSDSVTRITACGNNPKLKSVTFGKGIVNIGANAFSDCTSLKSIHIPNSVTTIEGRAFYECADLTSVTIPSSVPSIDRMLFQSYTSLTDVVIPNGVTSIGDQAFMGCTNLERVTIPDSVTGIDNWAFEGCQSLTDVYYGGTEAQWKAIQIEEEKNQALTSATIHYNSTMPQQPVKPKQPLAYASTQNVLVDGKSVEFYAYALKDEKGNDTNYVKLRDVAQILNGSAAQFEVGWDGSISITTRSAYTSNGSELIQNFAGNQPYTVNTSPVKVNGGRRLWRPSPSPTPPAATPTSSSGIWVPPWASTWAMPTEWASLSRPMRLIPTRTKPCKKAPCVGTPTRGGFL